MSESDRTATLDPPRAKQPNTVSFGSSAPGLPADAERKAAGHPARRTGPAGRQTTSLLHRARELVAPLAFGGAGLLIASELTDRLESIESGFGVTALNLPLASMLAILIVGSAALLGDSALTKAERRLGRRPGARHLVPLLTVAGATTGVGIIAVHLQHAIALDGWLGLGGSLLLLLAAGAQYQPEPRHQRE